MNTDTPFQTLTITILPSPETNDHQVRFLIDGKDLIAAYWGGFIGMDPDDILTEPCPLRTTTTPTIATIARCECGIPGCDNRTVEIRQMGDMVMWKLAFGHAPRAQRTFYFDVAVYNDELGRAFHDTSWETPDRTAARLLRAMVPHETMGRNGFTYQWASGRVRDGKFTVSLGLNPGSNQVLVHVPWDKESPVEIVEKMARLLAQSPETWPNGESHL